MSASQIPLISDSAEVVALANWQKRARRLLEEVGTMAFCKRRPDGTPGCYSEIFFVKIKGDRTRALNEDLSTHICKGEAKE